MSSPEKPAPKSPTHSSTEENLIQARRSKAEAVRARGENPFANDLGGPVIDLGALRARFDEARAEGRKYDGARVEPIAAALGEVRVVGRVIVIRGHRESVFLDLRDRTGSMQIFCQASAMGDRMARLDDLDMADHVEVTGLVMTTQKGELSVGATSVRLLTKALRPLPEKHKGLSDVEKRYRQRYVDLVANPEVRSVFEARTHIIRALRSYFDGEGFLEVETPLLHPLIGGAAAKPFETHHNALEMHLFLRIAPELYLKRLVVGGFERVYEIGRTFRNEGISTRHNPEFTMIEFYEAYATYEHLIHRTEVLLRQVDARLAAVLPADHARWSAERPFTLAEPFARVPMRQAVLRAQEAAKLPADVHELIAQPEAPIKQWAGSSDRAKKKIDWANYRKAAAKCESAGELLFAAYEYLAEPFLPEDYRSADGSRSVPVFITDYPFEMSPLARRKDADPSLVDRFELFVHGRELCNAFSELNDPDDQRGRFEAQVEKKSRGAEEMMDYDADYLQALEHGMAPAAGFGMGIDRLVMMLTNQASIRDVLFFPLLRPETT
jgi:lysyl-tRNA synthetase class 2